ncbi:MULTISPECIES: RbsD/FucU family protein [unclassified Aureimonas]|uniref:RbsD/FucU family protein n=1 Tax=unclassified Aureimonas TaxID=2615206 RepID=UPI0006F8456F|nr:MULTISPECIES: RbsD/FucU domain-containing protein [unclassified Aureimonas]KQT52448.1 ribose ABC transporter [Aureimonas sp. Leaf427]KQT77651.1 ribose ABC transporter [Aureimonas sp. Leaf460]
MLKTLHPLLTGRLLAILADMGHGNEIAIGDANFGAANLATRLVELPGASTDDILEAILSLLPLDDFSDAPLAVMKGPAGTEAMYEGFARIAERAEGRAVGMEVIEPAEFVARTARAYAVVSSGERQLYGNIILRKGVVRP